MLRPPQSLLAVFMATTVIVTAALCWAGWRLLDQQRQIDERRALEQLETTADAAASGIRGRLAEAGEWLSGWVSNPASVPPAVEGVVAVAIDAAGVRVAPSGGLPFVPAVQPAPPAPELIAAELLEFAQNRLADAAARYLVLAGSNDVGLRAGALLRLGRVLRKQGDFAGALAVYQHLAALGPVRTTDLPAELAGLEGQRAVYSALGDHAREQQAAQRLLEGLDAGRWPIARGVAQFLRESAGAARLPDAWLLADALADVWRDAGGRPTARGLRLFATSHRSVLVLWRAGAGRTALLATFPDRFFAPATSGATAWHLVDPEGRSIAGAAAGSGRSVVRVIGTSDYPWTLTVWPPRLPPAALASSRTILIAMMTAMLVFVWAALYATGRAIHREAGVARLQSDFVAAVSHEFRSPLTAVRQMAEMLEMDRVPSDERRRTYYRSIAGEAARLHRLVETLLNFGRMEAGAARYQFAEVDLAALVPGVVRDLESRAHEAGTRIDTSGPPSAPCVLADASAIGVAVRNLIDNAIKYSPGGSPVRVEWAADGDRMTIQVIDRGSGIPPGEQRAIFRKFVRGQAATAAQVPGTGIGLAVVEDIVRAHHGQIRVRSEVGCGSTFTLVLPLIERDTWRASWSPKTSRPLRSRSKTI